MSLKNPANISVCILNPIEINLDMITSEFVSFCRSLYFHHSNQNST